MPVFGCNVIIESVVDPWCLFKLTAAHASLSGC